jgi:hypothetical protein
VKGPGGLDGDVVEEGPAIPAGRLSFDGSAQSNASVGPSNGTGGDISPSVVKVDE